MTVRVWFIRGDTCHERKPHPPRRDLRSGLDRIQTTENQLRELRQVAARHGWTVAAEFADNGISGSKGRDRRPGLDAMMQAVARREVDVVMAWSGRSTRAIITEPGRVSSRNTPQAR